MHGGPDATYGDDADFVGGADAEQSGRASKRRLAPKKKVRIPRVASRLIECTIKCPFITARSNDVVSLFSSFSAVGCPLRSRGDGWR
eukprot:1112082-Rhodomonas_salina.3